MFLNVSIGDVQGKMDNSKKWLRTLAYMVPSVKNGQSVEK